MVFPLGTKLLCLGDLIREEHALRQNEPRDAPELAELRKRMKLAYNDAARFIRYHAPLEIKMAVGCITDICDPRLLRLLALVSRDQLFGVEGHPTLAEACSICVEPHAEAYESYMTMRHDIIESIAAGCYVASRSPIYHSTAVLRLSRRLAFLIGGGITSGLARMRDVQRESWRRDD